MNSLVSAPANIAAVHSLGPQPAIDQDNIINAEQAILGTLLYSPAAIDIVPDLSADDLLEDLHRIIFRRIKTLRASGMDINPVTVKAGLPDDVRVGEMSLSQYLAFLLTSQAMPVQALPGLALTISEGAARRTIVQTGNYIADLAKRGGQNWIENTRMAVTQLQLATSSLGGGVTQFTLHDAMEQGINRANAAYGGIVPSGIKPGLLEIEELTGRWSPGNLIVIGGGSKQGKSALAFQLAFTMAEAGIAGGIYSGEMSAELVGMREMARRTGVAVKRQRIGDISEAEVERMMTASAAVYTDRVQFAAKENRIMTLEQIESLARRWKRSMNIGWLVVDHCGKLDWQGKMANEEEHRQASVAMDRLKNLAENLGIVVIALTHLKRSAFQEYPGTKLEDRLRAVLTRRPNSSHLLGSVDKHADHVLIPFQPLAIIKTMEPMENTGDHTLWETYMDQQKGKAEIILAMSRHEEYPRRRSVNWHGETTCYSSPYRISQAINEGRLL
jgi:replicative DNA helicase